MLTSKIAYSSTEHIKNNRNLEIFKMQKEAKTLLMNLKGLSVLSLAVIIAGCVSAKSPPAEDATAATPPEPVAEPVAVAEPEPEPVAEEPLPLKYWTVVKGDNLWNIAANGDVYSIAEQWPLIYKSNLEQINDADLIYPGQILDIPRDVSMNEVDAAVHHAKNRGAWSLGPIEASDREYLRNNPG